MCEEKREKKERKEGRRGVSVVGFGKGGRNKGVGCKNYKNIPHNQSLKIFFLKYPSKPIKHKRPIL
jgi:hypothetical protein